MKNIAPEGEEYVSSTILSSYLSSLIGQPYGICPLDSSGLIASALIPVSPEPSVLGALGMNDSIVASSLYTSVVTLGLFEIATVSPYGTNGGQRNMYIESLSQSSITTKVKIAIDSAYEEDIKFHVIFVHKL